MPFYREFMKMCGLPSKRIQVAVVMPGWEEEAER